MVAASRRHSRSRMRENEVVDSPATGAPPDLPANLRDQRLRRPDGRTVAWVETGILDGRPMLRLPGTPGSRLALRHDQTPWLERGLRIINTERMGFGASTRLPARGFTQHADDLAAILDRLEIDRLPLIGGSGGAPHVLAFAARHPERVTAATIVVGAAPIADEEAVEMIGLNAEAYRLARRGDREGMVALLGPVRDAILADPLASFRETMRTAPPADQATMTELAWQLSFTLGVREALRPDVEGWVDESMCMLGAWSDFDPATIGVSVTWWHSDGDRNVPLQAVRRLVARLPNARLVIWPDAGHLTPYHHEGEILDDLLARG